MCKINILLIMYLCWYFSKWFQLVAIAYQIPVAFGHDKIMLGNEIIILRNEKWESGYMSFLS